MFELATTVCHVLLVETDQGLVLVDTGLGVQAVQSPVEWMSPAFVKGLRPRLDPDETAVRQLARLGYEPGDVRDIVLTHLDLDHAAGLADFPQARVHVHTLELAAARTRATRSERDRYRPRQWAHDPHWVEHDQVGQPWFGFEAVRDIPGLPEEILMIPLFGHTRGHVGVAVDTGSGWLLHAGDSYMDHREVARDQDCPAGMRLFERWVAMNVKTRLHNRDRLRELAGRDDVQVFSAHDRVEFERLASVVHGH
jgi:glyoxylase-like metal-dependent hydrolase (beta-lactamase superfamily II)